MGAGGGGGGGGGVREILRASESRECFARSLTQNESLQGRFEGAKESFLFPLGIGLFNNTLENRF